MSGASAHRTPSRAARGGRLPRKSERRLPTAFVFALAASAAIVLSSPAAGQLARALNQWLRPGAYVALFSGLVAVSTAFLLAAAAARIREHRAGRYAAIAIALVGAGLYARASATGNSQVDAVERIHFV